MDIPADELYIRYSATEYDVDLSLDWVSRWEHVTGVRPNMIAQRRSCKKSGLVSAYKGAWLSQDNGENIEQLLEN